MALNEYKPGTAFPGVIGRTMSESSPAWPKPVRAVPDAPNVLFIVLDDTGFGQRGCYGGPIGSLGLQSRDDRTGHWTFVARAVGSGHVVLRPAGVCMPPRLCPVAADAPIEGVHARIPGRGGIISIAVFVR